MFYSNVSNFCPFSLLLIGSDRLFFDSIKCKKILVTEKKNTQKEKTNIKTLI